MYGLFVWMVEITLTAVFGFYMYRLGRKHEREQRSPDVLSEPEGVDMRSRIGK